MDNFMTYGHRWIHESFEGSKTVDESILTIGISGIRKASNERNNKIYIIRRKYGH
jgi:hypothetical protein